MPFAEAMWPSLSHRPQVFSETDCSDAKHVQLIIDPQSFVLGSSRVGMNPSAAKVFSPMPICLLWSQEVTGRKGGCECAKGGGSGRVLAVPFNPDGRLAPHVYLGLALGRRLLHPRGGPPQDMQRCLRASAASYFPSLVQLLGCGGRPADGMT